MPTSYCRMPAICSTLHLYSITMHLHRICTECGRTYSAVVAQCNSNRLNVQQARLVYVARYNVAGLMPFLLLSVFSLAPPPARSFYLLFRLQCFFFGAFVFFLLFALTHCCR